MPDFQTFKDLNITFKPHPITGDLTTVKGEAAIKQAIVSLLLTNKGERLFKPKVGSSLNKLLFEPLDVATAAQITNEIRNVLRTYEPRISIVSLETFTNYDSNGFEVELTFEVIGREDFPQSVTFFLERTR
jgi:phage baseplate assembly protein W